MWFTPTKIIRVNEEEEITNILKDVMFKFTLEAYCLPFGPIIEAQTC